MSHSRSQYMCRSSLLSFAQFMVAGVFIMLAIGLHWHPALAQGLTPSGAPANSVIGNRASATFTDASGISRTVPSNTVETTVQQVAAVDLSPATQTDVEVVNNPSVFAHTVTNLGNGEDSFTLTAVNAAGDNYDLLNLKIYPDADNDGLPDPGSAEITVTPVLQPGDTFNFVVVGTVPNSALSGQNAIVNVAAASVFTPSVVDTSVDTTLVTTLASIDVFKTFTTLAGAPIAAAPPGSGPYLVSLRYQNTGNMPATNLEIEDVLPAGLIYQTDTGRWSVNATPLTDALAGDPNGISYSVSGTAGSTPRTVTAIVASVPPNTSGIITFQVLVPANFAPGPISNTATYSYEDGAGTTVDDRTNTATLDITQSVSLTYTGDTVGTANQGGTVTFTNPVTNTGNGDDRFNITLGTNTFPAGTTFTFYQSDGLTPLVDTNGDGIPDTGVLGPNERYDVIVVATLPVSATGGPYTVQTTATSIVDDNVSVTAIDTLTAITQASVDLTNAALTTGADLGEGIGPETAPVITRPANPGTVALFPLFVNNTSPLPDSYVLSVTTSTGGALPAGFTVVFRDVLTGEIISNTGTIAPGGSLNVIAEVTVPADATPQNLDLYFRVLSPSTGATDVLFDRVTVNQIRTLAVEPDLTGQTFPGGVVIYTHTITNKGNVAEGDGTGSNVALTTSNSATGFTSQIFYDANGNGVLDDTDPVISSLAAVSVGGDPGLDPGESATIFVRVTSETTGVIGTVDISTLTATATNVALTGTAPTDSAKDTTTITGGQLTLAKTQALDNNCDGIVTGYSTNNIAAGALPGTCIRYRIIVTNTGNSPATGIVVSDRTPEFTVYDNGGGVVGATGAASFTIDGTAFTAGTGPADGAEGTLSFNIGTLNPGQTATIYFGVKIR